MHVCVCVLAHVQPTPQMAPHTHKINFLVNLPTQVHILRETLPPSPLAHLSLHYILYALFLIHPHSEFTSLIPNLTVNTYQELCY